MRTRLQILALLAGLVTLPLHAQTASSAQDVSKFVGVWRGQFDNLPGVDLVIDNEGGTPQGAVLFYLHMRPDTKSPYTSTAGLPGPLLNMRVDGQVLHFQVSHRLAHPPRTLNDPPVNFHLKLTGKDQAELGNENEASTGLLMKRSSY